MQQITILVILTDVSNPLSSPSLSPIPPTEPFNDSNYYSEGEVRRSKRKIMVNAVQMLQ